MRVQIVCVGGARRENEGEVEAEGGGEATNEPNAKGSVQTS